MRRLMRGRIKHGHSTSALNHNSDSLKPGGGKLKHGHSMGTLSALDQQDGGLKHGYSDGVLAQTLQGKGSDVY